jgi:phosphoribosylformylglycinamidine (FGAM) synthase-like enzyme
LAECCFDTGLGASAEVPAVETAHAEFRDAVTLFGESASRVVVSVDHHRVDELMDAAKQANVPSSRIGHVGGDRIRIMVDGAATIDEALTAAERIWSNAIGIYFEAQRAIA